MPVQGFARPDQIPDIRRVWLKSFPEDTEEVVDTFLKRVDITEECLIYIEDDHPVSIVFLLPLALQLGGDVVPVQYIYAAGTDPAYRRRGIAGKLLNMAVEDLRQKNISPVYLLTDHTDFYERYGWEFFCLAQGEGEETPSRMYIHR